MSSGTRGEWNKSRCCDYEDSGCEKQEEELAHFLRQKGSEKSRAQIVGSLEPWTPPGAQPGSTTVTYFVSKYLEENMVAKDVLSNTAVAAEDTCYETSPETWCASSGRKTEHTGTENQLKWNRLACKGEDETTSRVRCADGSEEIKRSKVDLDLCDRSARRVSAEHDHDPALKYLQRGSYTAVVPDNHFMARTFRAVTYSAFVRKSFVLSQPSHLFLVCDDNDNSNVSERKIVEDVLRKTCREYSLVLSCPYTRRYVPSVETEKGAENAVKVVFLPMMPDDYLEWAVDKAWLLRERRKNVMVFVASEEDGLAFISLMRERGRGGNGDNIIPLILSEQHIRCWRRVQEDSEESVPLCAVVYDDSQVWLFRQFAEFELVIDCGVLQETQRSSLVPTSQRNSDFRAALGCRIVYRMYTRHYYNNYQKISRTFRSNRLSLWYTFASIYYNVISIGISDDGERNETGELEILGLVTRATQGESGYRLTRRGYYVYSIGIDTGLATFLVNAAEKGCLFPAMRFADTTFSKVLSGWERSVVFKRAKSVLLAAFGLCNSDQDILEVFLRTFHHKVAVREKDGCYRNVYTKRAVKCRHSKSEYVLCIQERRGVARSFVSLDSSIVAQVCGSDFVKTGYFSFLSSILDEPSTFLPVLRIPAHISCAVTKLDMSKKLCDIFERVEDEDGENE